MESIEEIKLSGPAAVTEGMLPGSPAKKISSLNWRGLLSAATARGLIGTLSAIAKREDALAWMRGIKTPLMVVSGAEDLIIPRERSAEIVKIQPQCMVGGDSGKRSHAHDGEPGGDWIGVEKPGCHISGKAG